MINILVFISDLEKCFLSHNELGIKAYTVKYRPWKIIYREVFENKKEAMQREKQLKQGKGREWLRGIL